jgi:hypothetical protein
VAQRVGDDIATTGDLASVAERLVDLFAMPPFRSTA